MNFVSLRFELQLSPILGLLTARRRRAVLAGGSVFFFFLTARRTRAVLAGGSVFFFLLVLSVTNPKPPRMMSSSANDRPFLSSFCHVPPQESFVQLAI